MLTECEKLQECPFFKKYVDHPIFHAEGFRKFFCEGPLMEKCVRRDHQRIFGNDPCDNLAPSGILCS